jgi:hypothetical protein
MVLCLYSPFDHGVNAKGPRTPYLCHNTLKRHVRRTYGSPFTAGKEFFSIYEYVRNPIAIKQFNPTEDIRHKIFISGKKLRYIHI